MILLTKEQLVCMLEMQSSMNAKVNPQWLDAGYPFLRAVMVECVEAIEHVGWKWWKAQQPDFAQLQMELVDIWHFALSDILQAYLGSVDASAGYLMAAIGVSRPLGVVKLDSIEYPLDKLDLVSKLELLAGMAVTREFSLSVFTSILYDAGMNWDDLYRQYVGKNVLNVFRQDNGYKSGTYDKTWDGREDNEHLTDLLRELDSESALFRKSVYAALERRYNARNPHLSR